MKWTGVVLCVTIAAAWLMSRWQWMGVASTSVGRHRTWGIERGVIAYRSQADDGGFGVGLSVYRMRPLKPSWRWIPSRWGQSGFSQSSGIDVPLWLVLLLTATPTLVFLYRDRRSARRSREGRCVGCGYDLSRVNGKCPECGRTQ